MPEALDSQALIDTHGRDLLFLAADSIRHGLETGAALRPRTGDWPAALTAPGASFVTLKRNGDLRGCIGSPEAWRALVEDVAEHAFNAAFRDPRFPPLQGGELADLAVSLSILTPPEPFPVQDESDLLARLEPGVDGLILSDGGRRGLFLPAVWESLPDPRDFLAHLKGKAGLPPDHWSGSIRFQRFRTVAMDSGALDEPDALWRPRPTEE